MWELLQSSIIPVIIVVILLKLFGGKGSSSSVPVGSKFDMDIISGSQVSKLDKKKKPISEVFAENDIVVFYFSAHWCPPCRNFTPQLASIYKGLKEAGKKIEVIFMSSDRTEEQMLSYMEESHGDWFAFEFGSPIKKKFAEHFQVSSIPTVIVLNGDGVVVSTDGRNEILRLDAGVWEKWTAGAPQ
ncbi:nucleoredoxin-like protein 2 [Galendromus occidentalis]|uniref:Nucleoredoxin-like protein 2 n=1 Tax=Galendromus occidentalis TaxID=34638 RepID=A0AAJ6QU96_9ACAR|nr:nucleoredoxin-like protein 2 [Galendromus occidentalis]